jgi:hypothetical protein
VSPKRAQRKFRFRQNCALAKDYAAFTGVLTGAADKAVKVVAPLPAEASIVKAVASAAAAKANEVALVF